MFIKQDGVVHHPRADAEALAVQMIISGEDKKHAPRSKERTAESALRMKKMKRSK